MTDNQTTERPNLSSKELSVFVAKTIALMLPPIAFAVIFVVIMMEPHTKNFHPSLGRSVALVLLGLLSLVGEILSVAYAYRKMFHDGFNVSRQP